MPSTLNRTESDGLGRRLLRALAGRAGLAIFTLALALRLANVLFMRSSPAFERPSMDALYHLQWARALASGVDYQPGPFFRAPLYIWFLAGVLKTFGPSLLIPRLIQSLFGALAAWLAYRLGRRAIGEGVGLVAGLFVATYWVGIYFDAELLIPTLIVPLDLLALWLTVGLARDQAGDESGGEAAGEGGAGAGGRALAAGLVWGLSAIARPNVLLVLPALALWLMQQRGLRPWRRTPRGGRPAAWLAFSLGVLLPILPISAYNRLVGGDSVLISSQAGVNFWIGNNPRSDGSSAIVPGTRGGWWEGYHDAVAQAEQAEGRELLPSEVSAHYSARAWKWIASEPAAALSLLCWKWRLFCTDWELGNNQEVRFFAMRYSPIARWSPLGFGFLFGFGCLGALLLVLDPARRARCLPLLAFASLYSLSVLAFFVCSRFRVPVLPLLALFGAHALMWCAQRARAHDLGRLAAGLGLALIAWWGSEQRPPELKTSEANGYLQLGNLAEGSADLRTAEAHYRYASQLDPGNPFAQVGLARVQLAAGRAVEAEGALQAILTLDPWRADALDIELRLLLQTQRLEQLEQLASSWSRRSPHLASPYFHRARARLAAGRSEEALRLALEAMQRDPRHLEALLLVAALQREAGRDPQAIEAYERSLSLAQDGGLALREQILRQLLALYEEAPPDAQSERRLRETSARLQALSTR